MGYDSDGYGVPEKPTGICEVVNWSVYYDECFVKDLRGHKTFHDQICVKDSNGDIWGLGNDPKLEKECCQSKLSIGDVIIMFCKDNSYDYLDGKIAEIIHTPKDSLAVMVVEDPTCDRFNKMLLPPAANIGVIKLPRFEEKLYQTIVNNTERIDDEFFTYHHKFIEVSCGIGHLPVEQKKFPVTSLKRLKPRTEIVKIRHYE